MLAPSTALPLLSCAFSACKMMPIGDATGAAGAAARGAVISDPTTRPMTNELSKLRKCPPERAKTRLLGTLYCVNREIGYAFPVYTVVIRELRRKTRPGEILPPVGYN